MDPLRSSPLPNLGGRGSECAPSQKRPSDVQKFLDATRTPSGRGRSHDRALRVGVGRRQIVAGVLVAHDFLNYFEALNPVLELFVAASDRCGYALDFRWQLAFFIQFSEYGTHVDTVVSNKLVAAHAAADAEYHIRRMCIPWSDLEVDGVLKLLERPSPRSYRATNVVAMTAHYHVAI